MPNFEIDQILISKIKKLPSSPGVYIFKDSTEQIIYIGKAKNLKNRTRSYLQNFGKDFKVDAILQSANNIEHINTKSELEAMLLEAQLIQSNQPKYNILLKSGQPFLYLMVTSDNPPELKITRNRKNKGIFFGPFLEKGPVRKAYDFLVKTFRLKICGKKIKNGCLYFHLGICSGSCRPDFGLDAYLERLELAKQALKTDHPSFLEHLKDLIKLENKKLNFEKARELHGYYQAFEQVFNALETRTKVNTSLTQKDIWILTQEEHQLFVFTEKAAALKKKQLFLFPFDELQQSPDLLSEYFISYYKAYQPPANILINFEFKNESIKLIQKFLQEWHKTKYPISITHPTQGHFASLLKIATIQAEQEITKQKTIPNLLKNLLKLPIQPHTIDCFDISHKQGMFMVGSCVRFTDGAPDKNKFRHFYIRSIDHQNDYAALHEIVSRRYQHDNDFPDLILIDGGKGQLNAVAKIYPKIEFASLAKKEETVYSKRLPEGKILDKQSITGQLLIALRDYAHHFAIAFHRKIRD